MTERVESEETEYIENEYEFMDDRIEIEESNLSESEDEPMATGSNRKRSIYKQLFEE